MTVKRTIENLIVPSSLFTRAVSLGGLLVALLGPFLLVVAGGRGASKLPWYAWSSLLLGVLLIIVFGVLRFRHVSHEAEAISISPARKGTGRGR